MIKSLSLITLRNTMIFKLSTINTFSKILLSSDLPYNFDQVNKVWWRWYSEIYGFYYNNIKRSYSIWLTMFLKKNIGVYISFFIKMPGKKSNPLDRWIRRAFLYQNTLIYRYNQFINSKLFTNVFFENPSMLLLSESAREILLPSNRNHRAVGSFGNFGYELDMFFSSYNYKWNTLYDSTSLFYNNGLRMPKNFVIVMNSFFSGHSFFINSFDSLLVIYPQYFLEYSKKYYSKSINELFSVFKINFNKILYINLIFLLCKIYFNIFYYQLKNYINIYININNDFLIYKLNIYIYIVKYFNDKYFINNNWFLFSIFINKYNCSNIFLYKKLENKNFSYIYDIFYNFFNYKIINWLTYKNMNRNYNWKYDFYFKFLNRLDLLKQRNIKFFNKFIYIKKFYILKLINSISKFKKNLKIKNLNVKYPSKFLIKKFCKLFQLNYIQIKSSLNLKNFFYNLKFKIIKNFKFKFFYFLKPSMKIKKNLYVMSTLKYVTEYGKYFTKLPEFFNKQNKYIYKYATFFPRSNFSTIRTIAYLKYNKFLYNNLINFISKFFYLIMCNLKINFGFIYNLIDFIKQKKNINVLDNYFFFNIQYNILSFFLFIKNFFNKNIFLKNSKNIFLLKKYYLYDKYFFVYLQIFGKNYLNKQKKFIPYYIYINTYKNINLKKFNIL